jgi:hypothetical protein
MVTRHIRTDGFVDPCIPTLAAKPPSGPDWVHEIKHDGYRLIVRRCARLPIRLFASIVVCLTFVFRRWRYGRHVLDHKERCHVQKPTSE